MNDLSVATCVQHSGYVEVVGSVFVYTGVRQPFLLLTSFATTTTRDAPNFQFVEYLALNRLAGLLKCLVSADYSVSICYDLSYSLFWLLAAINQI